METSENQGIAAGFGTVGITGGTADAGTGFAGGRSVGDPKRAFSVADADIGTNGADGTGVTTVS